MRRPIRIQIQWPVTVVVVSAVAVASLLNAGLNARSAREKQEDNLNRVVLALADSGFPLTQLVLDRMRRLSGAEFVVFEQGGRGWTSTLTLEAEEAERVRKFAVEVSGSGSKEALDPARRKLLQVEGKMYLCDATTVAGQVMRGGRQTLVVLAPKELWQTPLRETVLPPLLVGLGAVAAAAVVTHWLARRIVRPIELLQRQASAMAQGDFSPAPATPRDDEIHDLTVSLNHMAEQLGVYEDQVRRGERMRTLDQLGGGLAHQMRNSITGARMALELHQQECPLGADCETSAVALRQLSLMESYLQRFLTLGRSGPAVRLTCDLRDVLHDVLPLIRPAATHAHVALTGPEPGEPLLVTGDAEGLRQVLVNVLLNAVEAASKPDARQVQVEAGRSSTGRPMLTVLDNGPGPSPAAAEKMFEPFVSQKPHGAGLGLAVARQIAQQHQGTLNWRRDDGWTVFCLQLPPAE